MPGGAKIQLSRASPDDRRWRSRPYANKSGSQIDYRHSGYIGGMRSLQGAVIGGYLLALIDTAFNYLLPQDLLAFRDAFTFSIVIFILLWRPQGLVAGPATGQRT